MRCTNCGYINTKVEDVRKRNSHVWRRRICPKCEHRDSSIETWIDEKDLTDRISALEQHRDSTTNSHI